MRKKFLALTLSLMMGLSLTACGGEGDVEDNSNKVQNSTENTPTQTQAEEDDTEKSSLLDLPVYEAPDVSGTTWYFVGGMLNGVEMAEDKVASTLEDTYGGTLQFEFGDDGTVRMVQGGGALEGTYRYSESSSGLMVAISYDGGELRYACVFTEKEELTMIAMPDATGQNGLYFAQKEEN